MACLTTLVEKALAFRDPADLKAVGDEWASGPGTRQIDPAVARTLVDRGAPLSVHAAAGFGFTDHLTRILDADPAAIDAKGCDACTPLHFARDIPTAQLLLDRGARIDAKDEDHDSTPVQWLIEESSDVVRFLLERGATPDIFLAAALGDLELATRLVDANPACVAYRTGRLPDFPPIGHKGRGGTIYQWKLAFNAYPHQVALKRGHPRMFDLLHARSDTRTRFLVACVLARRAEAESIAAQNPGIAAALPPEDHELVARYCWETNTDIDAVRLMLDVGFPIAHPERSHGYSPLHNAAWQAAGDLVDLLIARGHPVDMVDPTWHATPLGFMMYDCLVEKRHPEGEFARVTKALLDAGSPWDPLDYPTGDERIDQEFRRRLPERIDGAAILGDEASLFTMLGSHPAADALSLALAGAIRGGHAGLARRLLDAGAPVNGAAGNDEETPLMRALEAGSHDMVVMLLERGADIAAKNRHGTLPLHFAAGYKAPLDTVRLLLQAGAHAHIDTPNDHGMVPRGVASMRGREDVAALFQEWNRN